jgi:hypothetical protein
VAVTTHELTVGDDPTTYAVVLESGRYLATTATAVDGLDLVDVHLPSGDTIEATVLRSDGPIVLLDMSGVNAAPSPHGEPPDLGDFVVVGAPDGDAPATVGEPNDHGFSLLVSDLPLHDSGPVYDGEGTLVGICTHGADARNWLVPVGMLDQMAADQGEVALTDSSTSAAPASSTAVATTTSSVSTTVATTTSVVTTSSAPTSTSAPKTSTSGPKTSSTSSTPLTASPTTVG